MSDDGKPKLASGDKALLHAAATGEGLIELTPDLMRAIGDSVDARKADVDERYPKLVAECPYETKLAVTAWVMQHIVAHAHDGGTFRYLIYDRLGFGPDAYMPLYFAGGMTISNEYDMTGEKKDDEAS